MSIQNKLNIGLVWFLYGLNTCANFQRNLSGSGFLYIISIKPDRRRYFNWKLTHWCTVGREVPVLTLEVLLIKLQVWVFSLLNSTCCCLPCKKILYSIIGWGSCDFFLQQQIQCTQQNYKWLYQLKSQQ